MTDHDSAVDAKPIENLTQHRRLVGRRTALVPRPFAPALPRPINQNDTMDSREPLTESKPHVFEVTAGTVKKNDGQRMTSFANIFAQLDEVLTETRNVEEAAAGRMQPLDQPRADHGHDGANTQKRGKNSKRVHQSPMGPAQEQSAPRIHTLSDAQMSRPSTFSLSVLTTSGMCSRCGSMASALR